MGVEQRMGDAAHDTIARHRHKDRALQERRQAPQHHYNRRAKQQQRRHDEHQQQVLDHVHGEILPGERIHRGR